MEDQADGRRECPHPRRECGLVLWVRRQEPRPAGYLPQALHQSHGELRRQIRVSPSATLRLGFNPVSAYFSLGFLSVYVPMLQ